MAVQTFLKPALPLLTLLPGLCLIPVVAILVRDGHGGGLPLLIQFAQGALQPSFDPNLLKNLWQGLQITLVIAVLSWGISSGLGVIFGFLGSRTLWRTVLGSAWPALLFRRLLSPFRAIHELIWGLLLLQIYGLNGWVAIAAIVIPYSALMARVIADQIDCHESPALPVLQATGGPAIAVLMTAVIPTVSSAIKNHIGHRLDCALRSALILGVFGLGGLGTDLMLSLQSLQFHDMWSGLWLLAIAMVVLDQILGSLQRKQRIGGVISVVLMLALVWSATLNLDLSWPSGTLGSVLDVLGDNHNAAAAFFELNWVAVIGSTLLITLMASCIATAVPPLLLLLWPSPRSLRLQSLIWGALRLLPTPLSALLLLVMAKPSLPLAALALGLHHSGVMGRVLIKDIRETGFGSAQTLERCGATVRMSWLYGPLAEVSRSYLAYASYRCDVILRDTVVVGIVGSAGLGWQLIDALSSFHWWLVAWLVVAFIGLTLLGETITERWQQRLNCKAVVL
ncbi:phosphonate ABC transporter [Synechococcus sp. AH-601-L23]|nr:phosphonate ABC transporter [Synechococcus sp. AH-601-L23]